MRRGVISGKTVDHRPAPELFSPTLSKGYPSLHDHPRQKRVKIPWFEANEGATFSPNYQPHAAWNRMWNNSTVIETVIEND
jgi:hypothetical protein